MFRFTVLILSMTLLFSSDPSAALAQATQENEGPTTTLEEDPNLKATDASKDMADTALSAKDSAEDSKQAKPHVAVEDKDGAPTTTSDVSEVESGAKRAGDVPVQKPESEQQGDAVAESGNPNDESHEDHDGLVWDQETGRFMPKSKPVAWRNSMVSWNHSVTLDTFSPRLSENPNYTQQLTLMPRWYLSKQISIRLNQLLILELTDTDSRARNQEVIVQDGILSLWDSSILTFAGFNLNVALRTVLPWSKASRAANRYFAIGPQLVVQRMFPGIADGLSFSLSGWGSHWFSGSNIAVTDESYPCNLVGGNGSVQCNQANGFTTAKDQFFVGGSLGLRFEKRWNVGTFIGGFWQNAHDLADATIDINGQPVTFTDQSATHWRNSWLAQLSLSCMVNNWLNVEAGLFTWTAQLKPDGSRRFNPINPDTQVYLTMTVILDQLLAN